MSLLNYATKQLLFDTYLKSYGPQVCILTVLIFITIWRKELSCNHVYQHHRHARYARMTRGQSNTARRRHQRLAAYPSTSSQRDVSDLLDGAGFSFSFGPILAIMVALYARAHGYFLNGNHQTVQQHQCYQDRSNCSEQQGSEDDLNLLTVVGGVIRGYFCLTSLCFASKSSVDSSNDRVERPSSGEDSDHCRQQESDSYSPSIDNNSKAVSTPNDVLEDKNPIQMLAEDVQVHIFSFLAARDLCNFATVSKSCRAIADDSYSFNRVDNTAAVIWSTILLRDYEDVLSWEIANCAFKRSMGIMKRNHLHNHNNDTDNDEDEISLLEYIFSNTTIGHFSRKELYFRFGEAWLDWAIAGKNSEEQCLAGLHGSVFNLTSFLESHPGTPETLMMQAGRDATKYFEDIGHSMAARKVCLECVVINRGRQYREIDDVTNEEKTVTLPLPMGRSRWRSGTLQRIRDRFDSERGEQRRISQQWMNRSTNRSDVLGDEVPVFFDVFSGTWQWWYTSVDLRPIFVEEWRR
uniref:Cytochrome b5 heme-binding domain-containing protein n=1 Tax=Leptocylindrus danicus TaxID=163516 RepID=A0A7S2K3U1_9STRA|mmetsp:Transcript_16317/g.24050  ORF Transcript_16317/g.24050 Transcript_16317/m.24050 type:complete len:521 (+) Transcript_16317:45-1607(+)